MLDLDMLREIFPKGKMEYLQALVDYWSEFTDREIDTRFRLVHFLAQSAEETGGMVGFVEHPPEGAYEGRGDLGNLNPGDGIRFQGRGFLQLTGKSNYSWIGESLGYDYIHHPELLEEPYHALVSSLEFWKLMNLNKYADMGDAGVYPLTKHINGGVNGLNERERWYEVIKRYIIG